MGKLKVNYNRPLHKKVEQKTGIEVFMYLDLPGVYYNSFELPVSDELAARAGFDIVKYGKMKKRREQLAIAMQAIDADLEMQDYSEAREIIEERRGIKLVHIGLGRHILEDPEGGKLVNRPLTLEEGKMALEGLVPKVEPLPVEPEKKKVTVKSLADKDKAS